MSNIESKSGEQSARETRTMKLSIIINISWEQEEEEEEEKEDMVRSEVREIERKTNVVIHLDNAFRWLCSTFVIIFEIDLKILVHIFLLITCEFSSNQNFSKTRMI